MTIRSLPSRCVFIGVDASGKFEMAGGFEPSALAAAVVSEAACREIAAWTNEAIVGWDRTDELNELHAAELTPDERGEVCEMLAARDDIRLAAVVSDQLLMGSREAVAGHRARQLEKVQAECHPRTSEGRSRFDQATALLADPRFKDHDYVYAVNLPMVVVAALQQAFCYFRGGGWRGEMASIRLLADEETPKTKRYCASTLLPIVGGDDRFSLTVPLEWRDEPVHPLYARAVHPDGDGLMPQACFGPIEWVSSHSHVPVQVADIAAWVIRRAASDPIDTHARKCLDLLRPLLEGRDGEIFQLFSVGRAPAAAEKMYEHLRWGTQPRWWLRPAAA